MIFWPAVIACFSVVAQAGPPSIAVISLEAVHGVDPGIARVVSESILQAVRELGTFSRVVGDKEVEAAAGMERTRQLMNCDTAGCLAEIAGALGVDLLLIGTVGRVGTIHVINVKIVSTRNAMVTSTAERQLPASRDEELLIATRPLVEELLGRGGYRKGMERATVERTGADGPGAGAIGVGLGALGAAGLVVLAAPAAAFLVYLAAGAAVFLAMPTARVGPVATADVVGWVAAGVGALGLVMLALGLAVVGAGALGWAFL